MWLVDNLALAGRRDEALQLLERPLGICNDVGLLAEEYDTGRSRQVVNFPQAFSHVALVAHNPNRIETGPAYTRSHS